MDTSKPSQKDDNGFLDSGGTFTTIEVPGADGDTLAYGINNTGHIVGYAGGHGFLYSGGTFTTIDVPGASSTLAHDINDAGHIVGAFYEVRQGYHGFLYSGGTFTTIDAPGALGYDFIDATAQPALTTPGRSLDVLSPATTK